MLAPSLDPAAQFIAGDAAAKRSLVAALVQSALHGSHGAFDNLGSLVAASTASPARLDLIEATVASTLLGALAHPPWHEAAARVATNYLAARPAGSAALAACLRDALDRPAAPQARAALIGGIERLADQSSSMRSEIVPVLLEDRIERLLGASAGRPSLVAARSLVDDIERLKVHCQRSPYEQALAHAFPAAAPAPSATPIPSV